MSFNKITNNGDRRHDFTIINYPNIRLENLFYNLVVQRKNHGQIWKKKH